MKNVFAIICTLGLMLSVALPGHAGGGRPSFSVKPSYSGGFRAAPAYRSFSPSPSRSFTFESSPVVTPRLATTAPTYHYSTPVKAQPISRSTTKRTVINNHYHGSEGGHSGGGSLSLMDYAILHSLTSHVPSPTYVSAPPAVLTAQPAAASAQVGNYEAPAVIYQQEESHFWRNFFLFIVGLVVVAAVVAACIHYLNLDDDE